MGKVTKRGKDSGRKHGKSRVGLPLTRFELDCYADKEGILTVWEGTDEGTPYKLPAGCNAEFSKRSVNDPKGHDSWVQVTFFLEQPTGGTLFERIHGECDESGKGVFEFERKSAAGGPPGSEFPSGPFHFGKSSLVQFEVRAHSAASKPALYRVTVYPQGLRAR